MLTARTFIARFDIHDRNLEEMEKDLEVKGELCLLFFFFHSNYLVYGRFDIWATSETYQYTDSSHSLYYEARPISCFPHGTAS